MVPRQRHTTLRLLGRSLLPSWTSGVLCVCCSVLLVTVHCLLLSVSAGTALPGLLDGQWAAFYTNTIVQPIDVLFNNLTFNTILSMVLWGAAGLALYSVAEFVFHLYREGREASHDVRFSGEFLVPNASTGRREYLMRVLWRAGVLVLGLLFLGAVHRIPQGLLATDARLVDGAFNLAGSLQRLAIAIIWWSVFSHCVVVLLRLFMMRTRLFGDASIE